MVGRTIVFVFLLISGCDQTRVYFTPGPDCEDNIIAEINSADKIDMAVYSVTNKKIADALISAHMRGAKIRVITDRLQSRNKYSQISNIINTGIETRINRQHKIEHNKFAIFDNKTVVTGSYNWTRNATNYNSENCIFTNHKIKKYTHRFEYLWAMYDK